MKVLVDMNLSPAWVPFLNQAGHEARHWVDVGAHDATDADVMRWSAANGCVVLTADLDFGAILAGSGAAAPSVVQLRSDELRHDRIGASVLLALALAAQELAEGAIVSVDAARARLRLLPLRR